MLKSEGVNYIDKVSNDYFIANNINKVLFLDIDGVLQPYENRSRFYHMENNDMDNLYAELKKLHNFDYSQYRDNEVAAVYYDWSKNSVFLLKDILIQTNAKIVLSSDWRMCGKEKMHNLFKIHDLHDFYIDDTIDFLDFNDEAEDKITNKHLKKLNLKYTSRRTIEILEYLEKHPFIDNYVAIDDKNLLPGLEDHFVNTGDFLRQKDADLAKKILK